MHPTKSEVAAEVLHRCNAVYSARMSLNVHLHTDYCLHCIQCCPAHISVLCQPALYHSLLTLVCIAWLQHVVYSCGTHAVTITEITF